jgi:PKD repeat protein
MIHFLKILVGSVIIISALCGPLPLTYADEPSITTYGPTHYASFEDSPFISFKENSSFYFEDFEDGALNVPLSIDPSVGRILGDNQLADSVDEDDGIIDGYGTQGMYYQALTRKITLQFNQNNGSYPSFAGLVITDALISKSFSFEAYDQEGTKIAEIGPLTIGDDKQTGETAEDTFVGFESNDNSMQIKAIVITSGYDFEMDHIQFGYSTESTVPTPPDGTPVPHIAVAGPFVPGTAIQLDGSQSRDSDGSIIRYDWRISDGTRSNLTAFEHIFANEGKYVITLSVTDNDGNSAEATDSIEVRDPGGERPQAVIVPRGTFEPGKPIMLDGTDSHDPDGGEIVSYEWGYGNGQKGTGSSVEYVFNEPGRYTAILKVIDDEGVTSQVAEKEIIIQSPPENPWLLGIVLAVISGGIAAAFAKIKLGQKKKGEAGKPSQ